MKRNIDKIRKWGETLTISKVCIVKQTKLLSDIMKYIELQIDQKW